MTDAEILNKVKSLPVQCYTNMFLLADEVKDKDIKAECEQIARRAFHLDTM